MNCCISVPFWFLPYQYGTRPEWWASFEDRVTAVGEKAQWNLHTWKKRKWRIASFHRTTVSIESRTKTLLLMSFGSLKTDLQCVQAPPVGSAVMLPFISSQKKSNLSVLNVTNLKSLPIQFEGTSSLSRHHCVDVRFSMRQVWYKDLQCRQTIPLKNCRIRLPPAFNGNMTGDLAEEEHTPAHIHMRSLSHP